MSDEGSAILDGILADAEREAATIIADAERSIEERGSATRERIKEIEEAAEKRIRASERIIMAEAESAAGAEVRKRGLTLRDDLIQTCVAKIKAHIDDLMSKDGYAEILAGWITEAAIGLGTDRISVNCSEPEKPFLAEAIKSAERKVIDITGAAVSLHASNEPPLKRQGVMCTSDDGKTIFDNRVDTRIKRYQSDIRMLVYKELFGA